MLTDFDADTESDSDSDAPPCTQQTVAAVETAFLASFALLWLMCAAILLIAIAAARL